MPDTLLTDEVWAALDPNAGRLSPRDTRRWWLAITTVLLVIAGGGLLMWSGLVRPRIAAEPAGWQTDPDTRTMTVMMQIENRGQRTIDVRGLDHRTGRGLELTSVQGLPASLAKGAGVQLSLTFRVTDCAVLHGPSPLLVLVERAWGEQTVEVEPDVEAWGEGAWQQQPAHYVCNPDEPPGAG